MENGESNASSNHDVMEASQLEQSEAGDGMAQSSDSVRNDVTMNDNQSESHNSVNIDFEQKCAIDKTNRDENSDIGATSPDETLERIDALINRLVHSDAFFKHQQRNEPDLTIEQKSEIARTLFTEHPVKFLSQFNKYLKLDHAPCFEHLKSDPTISVFLLELEKSSKTTDKNRVMNRRFQAMQTKTKEGSYFCEEEMRHRDPYLYEQMIGQYLSEEEKKGQYKEIDRSDHRFSTILFEYMDKCDDDTLYEHQKEKEKEQEEEEEDESGDEDENMTTDEPSTSSGNRAGPAPAPVVTISEEERALLRQEFLQIMQERFMAGLDIGFDYSSVDENADYDPLDIRGQDEEERYFDEMEPESVSDCETLDSDRECWTKPPDRSDTND